jgi:hypothetical protein
MDRATALSAHTPRWRASSGAGRWDAACTCGAFPEAGEPTLCRCRWLSCCAASAGTHPRVGPIWRVDGPHLRWRVWHVG